MTRFRFFAGLTGALAILAAALWLTSRPATEAASRPPVPGGADAATAGGAAFAGAGFGGISLAALQSNAVPWRLTAAALVLDEQRRDPNAATDLTTLRRALGRFGFLYPGRIANLPDGLPVPGDAMPLGMTWGDIAPLGGTRIRVANLGCAACHAGVTYRADGTPQPGVAMLGTPNTSLDLEAYTTAVYAATRRHAGSERLLTVADRLFPEMGRAERLSLRWLVLPLARRRLAELEPLGRAMPFPNGAPGSTNGVAALKAALGTPLHGGGPGDNGVVSIPDLGSRQWRTSLLVDGAYRIPGAPEGSVTGKPGPDRLDQLAAITSFFTVPSMGVHPDDAQNSIADARNIFAWLQTYRAQPFPGLIDAALVRRGSAVYAKGCAACHGTYRFTAERPELTGFPNWIGQVGTDPLRGVMFDPPLAAAVAKTAYRERIAVRAARGYAAPPLAALWASAPYLHNGSVPTLRALLAPPPQRPVRFLVGGHALDFAAVGLRIEPDGSYRAGYRPFSQPQWLDTRAPGCSNAGHVQGTALSAEDQRALIEFLKLL